MSLRAFHVAFIVVSIVLSIVVAAWGVHEYLGSDNGETLAVAIASLAAGAALVVYGARFFKKLGALR